MKTYLAKLVTMRKGDSEASYRSSIYEPGDLMGEKIAAHEVEKFVFNKHKIGFAVTEVKTINANNWESVNL